ncbi:MULTISPECIES: bifunctional metallophosphatase/5'-nucleotidase [Pseudonocardia]|uniref:Endonuclease YhcR n=2 Tax=Pseudonocardia TaxID=1847 RepID=A0A1Y2MPF8_PSEAH|nr:MULTISPECIES: bifunctional UDP-sugar hydrolase/5'-nucleotidase [Pseudonocardia]OSY36577.1 Endonuclease YhcR precursor [Pseudonocardia autotrophica]TDN76241.1 5'-nucleotidase [Pseudonocardia autotrophica]BBG00223.1 bifunctional metallophosphatase/5'-nucleotidase [Pseudonocardia autotrophica]GEC28716.1 bifunctional metallophosphatase/5'-nucleotidase [Pseudonocardia saturnea]
MPVASGRRTGLVLAAVFALVLAAALGTDIGSRGGSGPGVVRVIAFNDLHGNLEPPSGSSAEVTADDGTQVEAGGAAFLAAHVERLRAEQPSSVLLSAGDNVGASPLTSALFHDEPTIELLDAMGVAASAAGNHEFDEGIDELRRLVSGGCRPAGGCRFGPAHDGASFPVLAANLTSTGGADDARTGSPALPAHTVLDVGGTRLGVIGATLTELPDLVSPDGIRGIEVGDEIAAVDAASRELTAQGVRAQVLLVHQGDGTGSDGGGPGSCALEPDGPGSAIAAGVSADVDAVFSAHSHQQYVCSVTDPAGEQRPFVQGLSFGRLLSVVDLALTGDGDVDRAATTARNEIVSRDIEPDPAAQRIVDAAVRGSEPLAQRPVGTLAAPLPRAAEASGLSPLGTVIADAQLAASRGDGAQLALTNPGGVRADLVPGPDGRVTYGQAYTVQPFGNILQTMTLTGAQLRAVLDQQFTVDDGPTVLQTSSNVRYSVAGDRVTGIELDGAPVTDAGTYRVAVNNFLSAGGDGFDAFTAGTDLVGGPVDLDAFVAHLEASPGLAPPPTDRVTRD